MCTGVRVAGCLAVLLAGAMNGFAQQRAVRTAAPPAALVRTEMAYPTGERATAVVLLERFTPREVRAGQDLEYQIKLTNLTRVELREVVLTERFPANFTPRASGPKATTHDDGQATWSFSRLGPGATELIRVLGTTSAAGELSFCATVSFATVICANANVVEPQLALAKYLPAEVLACDPIPLRFVVGNTGTGMLRGVRITDALPEGLTTTDGKTGFALDVGELAAGQSREFTVNLRATHLGEITNTAQAQEEGGLSADASARVVVRQPALAITKRGPAMRYVGRAATFEITVRNTGDGPARNTILTDPLPVGTEFVAAEGGQLVGNNVTWNLGTLAPQATRTVQLTVKPTAIGVLENTATAEAYCARATAATRLDVRGISAILLEVVDDPDPIEIGGQVTYTIEVTNQGTAVGTNIVIDCALPAELQYVSATGPVQSRVEGQAIRFAPLASLAPKAKVTYKVVAKGTREADARFKVTLRSDQTTSPVEETESTHIY
jgi:uncharacterized repeat protein (TIGR01451 family)